MGAKKDLPKPARTSPWDHLVRIASNILCNLRALRGLNDPLSVDSEAFYTFYRTLKRWTIGTLCIGVGADQEFNNVTKWVKIPNGLKYCFNYDLVKVF